ncbi:amidohydrolase family protein [Bacillus oleivorans]|uniref:amidohydrolase family protein n=1 Tax=Bacillus oleivorans TaxID=1448271 RepID=UPI000BE33D69|nr:amidohydrolase family protein [Bacillus oleivorans]
MVHSSYWLTNVLLETGYKYEHNEVIGTNTDLFHILIKDGEIAKIVSEMNDTDFKIPVYDAKKKLMLPAFKEMHIHIDKSYYGGPWKAVRPVKNIMGRFKEERELLPKQLPFAKERAEKILNLLVGYGSTHVRTHCNIDPVIGLKNLEATMGALDSFAGKISSEVVAFPQHGLLRSDVKELVKESMKHGAALVGGVDPATVDENIEESLYTMMDIAVEADAGVDIHIHDRDYLGIYTMKKLADLTEEAGWQGRVTVSHAFGFAGVSEKAAAELAERFAELRMKVTSTVPIGRLIMPLPLLREKGVRVELGTDSLTDHWSPFGTGDNLEKASRLAEVYGYADEYSLSQTLGFITGGITPLNKKGEQVWPVAGEKFKAVFVEASCSAEAVARKTKRAAVFHNGVLVSGQL